MRIIFFILLSCSTLFLYGQCPDRSFLWNRILYLQDSSAVPENEQLTEMLGYFNKINSCYYKNDSTHALLLHRIGFLFLSQKDFYNAIKFTTQSIELISKGKNSPAINPGRVVKSYYNLYLEYEALKLEKKKQEAIDSCISKAIIYKTGYNFAAYCFNIKTETYYDNGDYYKCLNFADEAYRVISSNDEIGDKAHVLFNYFTDKINALTALGKIEEAEKLLLSAIDTVSRQKQYNHLGTLYGLYGTVCRDKNKYDQAIVFYKESFFFHRKTKYNTGSAEALNNIGFVYENRLNKNSVAIVFYKKALKYADAEESLNIYANIANVYVKTKKFDSAFYFFKKAFEQIQPGFSEADLLKSNYQQYNVNITEYLAALVLDKADAFVKQYKITASKKSLLDAVQVYKTADLYFDKIKNEQAEIQSRLFWKTSNRRLYEHAIEACLALDNKSDAFYFFEKSRSVLLSDQVKEQKGLTNDELTQQGQLKTTIAALERTISDTASSAETVAASEQSLFTKKQELERMNALFKQRHPYLSEASAAVPSIGDLQKKILSANKILVELFYGDSAVYMFSVTQNDCRLKKIDKQLYDSLTNTYISLIANPILLNKKMAWFTTVSHSLYQLLFTNVTLPVNGSMIVSPDGKSFPFEGLVTDNNAASPNYLLQKFATSYTYSARYLLSQPAAGQTNTASLLGMAPVVFNSSFKLPALYGSDASLQHINAYFGEGKTELFDKATSDNFSTQFYSRSIVQLYTHAAENSGHNDPVIYFADKAFYLSDLVAERQPVTRLVVLSACETAKGKFYGGEGIFSFNRGFAALGIPAAISNLWSADNESTYRLTELFYKFLSKGMPTDVALQQAKIEFINTASMQEKKLPFFWAGTILTGKVETFKLAAHTGAGSIAVTGGLLLLLTGAVIVFRKKIRKPVV